MLIKPTTNFAKIRVMGIGGGGTNALNSMITQSNIQGLILLRLIPMRKVFF